MCNSLHWSRILNLLPSWLAFSFHHSCTPNPHPWLFLFISVLFPTRSPSPGKTSLKDHTSFSLLPLYRRSTYSMNLVSLCFREWTKGDRWTDHFYHLDTRKRLLCGDLNSNLIFSPSLPALGPLSCIPFLVQLPAYVKCFFHFLTFSLNLYSDKIKPFGKFLSASIMLQ